MRFLVETLVGEDLSFFMKSAPFPFSPGQLSRVVPPGESQLVLTLTDAFRDGLFPLIFGDSFLFFSIRSCPSCNLFFKKNHWFFFSWPHLATLKPTIGGRRP